MSYSEDPVFKLLREVRGGGELPDVLAASWQAWSGQAPRDLRLEPGRCAYHPFDHAWAVVRAEVATPANGRAQVDIALNLFARREAAAQAADACRQLPVAACGGPPLFTHEPWGLVGWTLPNGHGLQELRRLLRPDALRMLSAGGDGEGFDPARYGSPSLHRYVPASDAVVRWPARDGGAAVFARLSDSESVTAAYSNLAKVHAACQGGELEFRPPVPLGFHPEMNSFLARDVEGAPLADLLGEGALAPCLEAGRALASLHRSSIPPSYLWTAARERAALAWHMRAVAVALPGLAPRLAALVDRLSRHGAALAETAAVPIHGALSCDEINYGDGGVGMTNWESLALGDPLHDVGRLAAHVAYLVGREDLTPTRGRACLAAFGQGYRKASGLPLNSERLAWHLAVSLLRHGKRRSLERLPREWTRHLQFVVEQAELALAGRSAWIRALHDPAEAGGARKAGAK